ncbi:MAG: lysyl-tRNA synthetase [Candidatus Berkelbacteria bacterium Licking1014_7]|uniref:Lysine--tRNA ligase n=1 Tax=Candidatus Berkelbacteria bacterium Licking1014_7 TaxID=2017147 RepID=A0A554LHM4_9BACT|nr:MAG: lysyl-tRNA synthetase [Candidatus Berkelbacteria bacterium Licking1014_7]
MPRGLKPLYIFNMQWVEDVIKLALKRKPAMSKFVITDWKTPSGKVHLGALRGALIHDAVYKSLLEKNKKAVFYYGFDDYDPMDKLPKNLPESFQKYLGFPFSEIPLPPHPESPAIHSEDECGNKKYSLHKASCFNMGCEGLPNSSLSYGTFFSKDFQQVFEKLDVTPKILWSSKLYKQGKFNCTFDIVIKNAQKIREIYQEIASQDRPKDWLAVQMVCKNCGRIGTTRAYDFREGKVYYSCDRDYVKYTKGCGYKGAGSPYDGNAKLPWKVEWAAKWFILGTDIEGAGKDHQTKGGSHDLASAIFEEVFKGKTPINIAYEHFLIEGKKMSTSKGLGMSASGFADIMPAHLARFFILKFKPKVQIDFNMTADFIPRLYDSFDATEKQFNLRFSKVAFLAQMPHIDIQREAQKEKGSCLTAREKQNLSDRVKFAHVWLEKIAYAKYKFELQKTLPKIAIASRQKKFLTELLKVYQTKKHWQGADLHQQIHKIKHEVGIEPKLAFEAIYQIFLGRNDGPQAGWFLAGLEYDFVKKRLKQSCEITKK